MQLEFRTHAPERDISQIARLMPQSASPIFVDGHSGVGKSRLSRALSKILDARLVQVDEFIVKNRPGRKYVPRIDRSSLAQAMSYEGQFVVDGLCLRHLCRRHWPSPSFWMYIQSEAYGDGLRDEIDRRRQFGTDLYVKRYRPASTADLLVTVPYQF